MLALPNDGPAMGRPLETALAGGYLDGNLYGLPYEIHPGNPALIAFNVDMLDAAAEEVRLRVASA